MSDRERRLRGLLSQKRMTNQILRERNRTPQVAQGRVFSPDLSRVPAPAPSEPEEEPEEDKGR